MSDVPPQVLWGVIGVLVVFVLFLVWLVEDAHRDIARLEDEIDLFRMHRQ